MRFGTWNRGTRAAKSSLRWTRPMSPDATTAQISSIGVMAGVASLQRKAVALAFLCNFLLMGSYYILRPVRDTVATIVGVGQLQQLFTATFIGTFIASGIY